MSLGCMFVGSEVFVVSKKVIDFLMCVVEICFDDVRVFFELGNVFLVYGNG